MKKRRYFCGQYGLKDFEQYMVMMTREETNAEVEFKTSSQSPWKWLAFGEDMVVTELCTHPAPETRRQVIAQSCTSLPAPPDFAIDLSERVSTLFWTARKVALRDPLVSPIPAELLPKEQTQILGQRIYNSSRTICIDWVSQKRGWQWSFIDFSICQRAPNWKSLAQENAKQGRSAFILS